VNAELQNVVKGELDSLGYDLVLLRQGGSRTRPRIEVRIDRRDGHGVTVEDCTRVSRAIEARLDARAEGKEPEASAPLVERRYELQVSSPGRGSPNDRII
jgi:ribosome maturation factor RimP